MRYRPLHHGGPLVSEIGFGAWGIGGTHSGSVAYGATDDAVSLRALRVAAEMGINFFDTSSFYGLGHSESLIGEALQPIRNEVFIGTKGGMLRDASNDFAPSTLEAALRGSLERLRTDRVDLYLLHSPTTEHLGQLDDAFEWMQVRRQEGAIRAIGVSVRAPEHGITVLDRYPVQALQANFNLADQRALACGLEARCAKDGVGLIARTPLCFGFLTGAFENYSFSPDDHRSRWSEAQLQKWRAAPAAFRSIRERYGESTLAQFSLRYILSYSGFTTAIPGILTAEHAAENARASEQGALRPADLAEIDRIYGATEFVAR